MSSQSHARVPRLGTGSEVQQGLALCEMVDTFRSLRFWDAMYCLDAPAFLPCGSCEQRGTYPAQTIQQRP